ncbi:regulatory protein RecX [Flavobacterium sp. I3-2]|uniref:regulatory protein RecX n=1 Tax=Flavobacterium sp. I3-2 TaxID=2748319 RepID=UPI0015A7DBAB|nr:regulatory protein RecX [Flavobacterium sp. I3-2]
MNPQGLTVEQATKKIEFYCAYQERCHKEVVEKLKTLGIYETAINHIINHLLENNFLNEERFAKAFARGKHKFKYWGKRRIEQELKFRDVSSYNIKTALKEIETDYLSNFYTLADRKWETITDSSFEKKKKKWIDYLIRKGYETNLIFEALKNYN